MADDHVLDPLVAINKTERLRKWCAGELVVQVDTARKAGWNWDQIALALDISRVAAMARYAKKVSSVDLRRHGSPQRVDLSVNGQDA